MNTEELCENAARVAAGVLEQAAFLFADQLERVPDEGTWEPLGVELRFSGYRSGTVRLWADRTFCMTLAANMMGLDDGAVIDEAGQADGLRELLNIYVGNLLTELHGDEPVFDLGIPTIGHIDKLKEDLASLARIQFEVEGGIVLIALELDSSTPA